jgi:hypothetical protein
MITCASSSSAGIFSTIYINIVFTLIVARTAAAAAAYAATTKLAA